MKIVCFSIRQKVRASQNWRQVGGTGASWSSCRRRRLLLPCLGSGCLSSDSGVKVGPGLLQVHANSLTATWGEIGCWSYRQTQREKLERKRSEREGNILRKYLNFSFTQECCSPRDVGEVVIRALTILKIVCFVESFFWMESYISKFRSNEI